MKRVTIYIATTIFLTNLIYSRPLSAPLEIFEETKLPRRTLKEGPSIFGTLPFFDEKNATKKEREEYQKMVEEVKEQKRENENYRQNPARRVFEETKIKPNPNQSKTPVRKFFEEILSL